MDFFHDKELLIKNFESTFYLVFFLNLNIEKYFLLESFFT